MFMITKYGCRRLNFKVLFSIPSHLIFVPSHFLKTLTNNELKTLGMVNVKSANHDLLEKLILLVIKVHNDQLLSMREELYDFFFS